MTLNPPIAAMEVTQAKGGVGGWLAEPGSDGKMYSKGSWQPTREEPSTPLWPPRVH